MRRKVPGSDSVLELAAMARNPGRFLLERQARHGDVFRTWLGKPVVVVGGAELNRSMHLTQRGSLSVQRAYLQTAFGRAFEGSLLTKDGAEHDGDRKLLERSMGDVPPDRTLEAAAQVWRYWLEKVSGRTCNVYPFLERAFFEVVTRSLLRLELGAESDSYFRLTSALLRSNRAMFPLAIPFGRFSRAMRARKELTRRLELLFQQARASDGRGLLGALSRARRTDGRALDDQERAAHLFLIWLAYETVAATASWLLHELARAPAWQARLLAEQQQVLGDGPLRHEHLAGLVQHRCVIREVERLHPVGIFFPRLAVKPLQLDAYTIPSGTSVVYSAYLSQRTEALFEAPHEFRPERWIPSRVTAQQKAAMFSFGGGGRTCLGRSFALLQLHALLCAVLRGYSLQPDARGQVVPDLFPVNRLKRSLVRFVPRPLPASRVVPA